MHAGRAARNADKGCLLWVLAGAGASLKASGAADDLGLEHDTADSVPCQAAGPAVSMEVAAGVALHYLNVICCS